MTHKQPIKSDEWRTPPDLFKQLNVRFYFTMDAAATSKNSTTFLYLKDGLSDTWSNERIFCNPPFSQKAEWIKKMHDEVIHCDCPLCVMILPNCIDTKAFNKYIHGTFHWEHLPYRVSFLDENGNKVNGNPSGTIIVYAWKKIERK